MPQPFKGTINVDVRDSVPDWEPYMPPRAPDYNFLGAPPEQTFSSQELAPGRYVIGMDFAKDSVGEHNETIGTTRLHVDDQVVAEGTMRTQVGTFTLCGDGLCVGRDSSDPVSSE